ncbi:MAG: acyl-phosphate glycerol 3-phosphate acyltransferase [Zetaproteobacteria bacterium]|nr:MAG: acyl-phosphate glycerol 3-phosphate acyltransferase [Zetaproteobacteria bacterium]
MDHEKFAIVANSLNIPCIDCAYGRFLLLFIIVAYFVGSIPFGLLITKLLGYGDIRKSGSGNIGATNVLRIGNKKLAAATLALDASKAAIIVHIAYKFIPYNSYPRVSDMLIVGLFAILGHCFPIWLKFKGGKGVATALGAFLAAVPYVGLAACMAWILTAKITKISSLSALVAAAIAPFVTFFIYGTYPAGICALITLLVWIRHKDNIKRLLKGEEPKIGAHKNNSQKKEM